MISLFCLRSQPNEEASLAAKLDSPEPPDWPDASRMPLLRLEEAADDFLAAARSDSVDDESVDVLQLRAMLRADGLRDGMFWWLLRLVDR